MKSKKEAIFLKLAITVTFVVGAFIFLYPFVSNIINTQVDRYRIEEFEREAKKDEQNKLEQKKKRDKETENQVTLGMEIGDELFDEVQTSSRLDSKEIRKHVIGSISIPKINSQLPIFDETTSSFLQEGITLLPGTSFPLGGKSTHSVLTGHTGLANKKLFTDLKEVGKGDNIYLNVMGETLVYKVDQIKTVLPNELDDLKIQEDKDFLTLITCTPYMVNTHRLLVRGHRIPFDQKSVSKKEKAIANKNKKLFVFYLLLIILLITLMIYVSYCQYNNYRITKQRYRLKIKLLYEGVPQVNKTFVLTSQENRANIIEARSNRKGEIRLKNLKGGHYLVTLKEVEKSPLEINCFIKNYKSTYFTVSISKKSDFGWQVK